MGTGWRDGSIASPRRVARRPRRWPRKALLVFDPALEVITELVPSADAYTQERALLPAVLERVQPGELWIADRNFCTKGWLWGLDEIALKKGHRDFVTIVSAQPPGGALTVLAVLPDRCKETVKGFLASIALSGSRPPSRGCAPTGTTVLSTLYARS